MASITAKKAAGTFIQDSIWNLPPTLAWLSEEGRHGNLASAVKTFCDAQDEIIDQGMLVVEGISCDCIRCRIPCRCYDAEADGTFSHDVCFEMNPRTGACRRTLTN